ncbi:MAG TPA: hypothetical protein VHY34_00130, partial [Caulobacteraceae bacterium]|nr:hypothetical protein [Caulobacteraceae bacterium]
PGERRLRGGRSGPMMRWLVVAKSLPFKALIDIGRQVPMFRPPEPGTGLRFSASPITRSFLFMT